MPVNKKVFILEDDPARIQYFKEQLIGGDLTIISSCEEADKFQPPYDMIFLDHDLGGRQFEEHEDCGLTFVKLMKEKFQFADPVVIHSYNGDGVKNMTLELPEEVPCVYAPFRGPLFNTILDLLLDTWGQMEEANAKGKK